MNVVRLPAQAARSALSRDNLRLSLGLGMLAPLLGTAMLQSTGLLF